MNYKLRKQLNEDATTNSSFEEKVAEVKQQLQNGADPNDVFDTVYDFHDGFAWVKLNGKYNFINTKGELVSNRWFDNVDNFNEYGFALVNLNGIIYNIDTKGNLYDLDGKPINKVTENKRRVLRITESQLRNTIKKVVTQYLNESRRR